MQAPDRETMKSVTYLVKSENVHPTATNILALFEQWNTTH